MARILPLQEGPGSEQMEPVAGAADQNGLAMRAMAAARAPVQWAYDPSFGFGLPDPDATQADLPPQSGGLANFDSISLSALLRAPQMLPWRFDPCLGFYAIDPEGHATAAMPPVSPTQLSYIEADLGPAPKVISSLMYSPFYGFYVLLSEQ